MPGCESYGGLGSNEKRGLETTFDVAPTHRPDATSLQLIIAPGHRTHIGIDVQPRLQR